MSILNRRNAMVGWAVWSIAKQIARRKARAAVPEVNPETKRPNRAAIVLAGVAAAAGALFFWRRRDGGRDEWDGGDRSDDGGDAMG